MTPIAPPQVVCIPRKLEFGDPSTCGVTVFRLRCSPELEPKLVIRKEERGWVTLPMVKECLTSFYLAERLNPGRYYYHFLIGDALTPDTANTGRLWLKDGRLVNVVEVTRPAKEVRIFNRGTRSVSGKVKASHSWLAVEPTKIELPAGEACSVRVTPLMTRSNNALALASVKIIETSGSHVMAVCPVSIQKGAGAPSLDCRILKHTSGSGSELELQATGKGLIKCTILDRLTPAVVECELVNGQEGGFFLWRHRLPPIGPELAKGLNGLPAVLVHSNSPFPEERMWRFAVTDMQREKNG